jgi:O-Antigen ligase
MELLALPSPYTDFAILAFLCLQAVFFALIRPESILKIIPFSLSFTTFYIFIGTKWSADKLLPMIFFIACLLYVMRSDRRSLNLIPQKMLFFALFLICTSTILGFIYLPESEIYAPTMQMPGLRTSIRAFFYIVSLAYCLAPLLFLPIINDKLSTLKMYTYAGAALSVYAVYQYIAFYFGLPYRGIKYWGDTMGYGALETMGGLFRANGLANEPKQLSMYCITAVVCSFMLSRTLPHDKQKFLRIAFLLFCGFVLAFSGSGFLAVMLFIVIAFIISLIQSDRKYHIPWFRILLAVPILIAVLVASGYWSKVTSFVNATTFDRVHYPIVASRHMAEERTDYYLMSILVNEPSFVLTGFGMGNEPFWIFDRYHVGIHPTRGISPVDSGWLNLLADFGIISIVIFFIIMQAVIRDYILLMKNNLSFETRTGVVASFYSFLMTACLMLFVSAFNLLMFWLGMFYAYKNIAMKEITQSADQAL